MKSLEILLNMCRFLIGIDADMLFLYNDTERLHCIWDAAQSDHNR